MGKVRITQVRSVIGRPKRQKTTMQVLGLRKINQSVERELTAPVAGMIAKIQHLVKVEEI